MTKQEQHNNLSQFFSNQYQKLVKTFRAKYESLSTMEVEDIVSGLMIDLFNQVDIGERIENLGAYIYRSIQFRTIDYLRHRKHQVSLSQVPPEGKPSLEETHPALQYDMQTVLNQRETQRRLVAALDQLEPKQRAVWVATELDGYAFRELSELWHIPIGTLLSRKHRAEASLQKALADLIEEDQTK